MSSPNDPPVVKSAVDLFLDDVAGYLEECTPTKDTHPKENRLWHALLYLSRAVRSQEEEIKELKKSVAEYP